MRATSTRPDRNDSTAAPGLVIRILRAPLRWVLLALWLPLLLVSQIVYGASLVALTTAGRLGAGQSEASS